MSLRSFLSGLVSSRGGSTPSVPEGPPVELTRSHALGVGTVRQAALSPDGAQVAVATSLGVAVYRRDDASREAWFQATPNWAVAVGFSGDGERVIGATNEGQAWVWSASSGEPIAELSGEGKLSCALDRDGRIAVIGGRAGAALWDADGAARLRALEGTSNEVHGLAFHPDNDRVAAVDHSGHVMIWDVASGRELARWRPGNQPLFGIAFSPDGEHVAAVGKEWTVWNLSMGVQLHSGVARTPMLGVAFSSDGEHLLCGDKRNRAAIWNIGTGELDGELRCHIDDVHSVAFAPGDEQIVLASQKVHWLDRRPATGDGAGGESSAVRPGCAVRHSLPVFARVVAVASAGDSALVAVADKQAVTVWERASGEARAVLDGHTHSVRGVSFLPSGDGILSHSPREVIAWDLASGRARWQIRGFGDGTSADVGHVAGAGLFAGAEGGVLAVVESTRGHYVIGRHSGDSGAPEREIARLPRRGSGVDGFAPSPDGRRLALRTTSRVAIWNLAKGVEERTIEGAARCDRGLVWSPDGQTLIVAMNDRSVTVWDAASGRKERTLADGGGTITGLVPGRDGVFVAGMVKARPADRVVIWHVASGEVVNDALHDAVHQGRGGAGAICHAMAISPDNRTVVAGFSQPSAGGSEAGLWIAWHMATGEVIHEERGPAIWALGFTADGETLITASGEGQATLWNLRQPG